MSPARKCTPQTVLKASLSKIKIVHVSFRFICSGPAGYGRTLGNRFCGTNCED
jgi:hypothetical protein